MKQRDCQHIFVACTCLALVCSSLLAQSPAVALETGAAGNLVDARRRLDERYRRELAELANAIADDGDAPQAKQIRQWLTPHGAFLVLFDPRDAVLDEKAFNGEFITIRKTHADALFDLARKAAEAGRAALALQWATETVRENPNHTEARRVLGYVDVEGRWLTHYAKRQKVRGYVWHNAYGWIKEKDVARYDAGERPRGRRWISAEESARRHRTIDDGWVVRTEHFSVRTNHSLEAGVQMAQRLETLHAPWRQLFAAYSIGRGEVRKLFTGARNPRRLSKPRQVRYYRSRDEYNAALIQRQPQIRKTLGIYFDRERLTHFFSAENQHPATIYHEATHQLFAESGNAVRNAGLLNNFWIVEGIATYMESLEVHSGSRQTAVDSGQESLGGGPTRRGEMSVNHSTRYYTLGSAEAGRLPVARERLLVDRYYVPFGELVQMGRDDFQRRKDIAQLYSQLAGQTAFLMHAGEGKYRDATVEYLAAVYANRADENSLSERTGVSYRELDRGYQAWLRALP